MGLGPCRLWCPSRNLKTSRLPAADMEGMLDRLLVVPTTIGSSSSSSSKSSSGVVQVQGALRLRWRIGGRGTGSSFVSVLLVVDMVGRGSGTGTTVVLAVVVGAVSGGVLGSSVFGKKKGLSFLDTKVVTTTCFVCGTAGALDLRLCSKLVLGALGLLRSGALALLPFPFAAAAVLTTGNGALLTTTVSRLLPFRREAFP